MIKSILTVLFVIYVLYAIFMASPFGFTFTLNELDNDKPCYSIIVLFALAIPMIIIGYYLGIIK